MKVSGFTIVRNAVKYDYPVVEAISSILPVCDEVIVSIGNSEDGTEQLIRGIQSPKIKIVHSVWDDSLRIGGKLLAVETDKAKAHVSPDADWCFYIQADEVLHEDGCRAVIDAMNRYKDNARVDGLLFNYRHFYGSYEYVGDSYNWYRKEIRIVKNNLAIHSWGDAQGFRKLTANGVFEKLQVKPVDAYIHHYGWVKPPEAQQRKQESFHKMWHDDEWMKQNVVKATAFDYGNIDSLQLYTGSHPVVMQARITAKGWHFEFDTSRSRMKLKYRLRKWIERVFGISIGEYKNYRVV